ncbi:MAG: hypothetical protein HN390_03010 [Anaerolineae bacterium]|nr:hypothetical protein [Anaerolineae bacterium]MBT7190281.1 hypothetical protein [Anaerolineae bacterium]MBT7990221.1 hypothetical protein [Anaerolineae bacterium]
MKRFYVVCTLLAFAFLISACGGEMLTPPTETPVPTNTALPTSTVTPKPTLPPTPTHTEVPPTPTAAPVGVAVTNDKYEVTVVKVRKLETVFLDNDYHWVAQDGYLFLEIGVKVKSLDNSDSVRVPWNEIYIVEDSGDAWYPGWAGFKSVASGIDISPTSIIFEEIDGGYGTVDIDKGQDVFLRLIYTVVKKSPTVVLFGFHDSPFIEVSLP